LIYWLSLGAIAKACYEVAPLTLNARGMCACPLDACRAVVKNLPSGGPAAAEPPPQWETSDRGDSEVFVACGGFSDIFSESRAMLHSMNQATQKTMKAIALDRFGGLETMKLQILSVPEVGPDEVLIHVEWAGVGKWDPFEREGGFAKIFGIEPKFPYVLGSDGAGTIAAVGDGVKGLKPGDRVYAFGLVNPKGGFYAEYVAVKAADVSRIPGELTTQQAGALPVDAMTALRGLDDTLGLKPNESVMIFGASGGIGHLAVQLAKRMGVRVFAVASGSDGVALVKRLSADAVIDGHKEDIVAAARQFAPDGLDAALITAGGPAADEALTAIHAGGRVAYPNGVEPTPEPRSGIEAKAYDGMPDPQAIEKLNGLVESEGLPPFEVHIGRSFPLDQAAEAHRALDEHYLGKLVLRTA
jgi:NADPH2:quinone reductase